MSNESAITTSSTPAYTGVTRSSLVACSYASSFLVKIFLVDINVLSNWTEVHVVNMQLSRLLFLS